MKENIEMYSNPIKVLHNAKKIYGDDVEIDYSTRNDKKYMIRNPNNNKWIHFGAYGMEDYTKHKNKKRRESFLRRNHKWADLPLYSAGFMSFHLLW